MASDRATTQRGGGKYAVTLLASRVDTLAQRLEKLSSSPPLGSPSGSTVGVYAICETCGVQGHTSAECYNAIMAYMPLSTLMLFRIFNLHHSIFPSLLPIIRGKRATQTPHTQSLSHLLNMPCAGFQPRAAYTPPPPPPPPQPSTAHLESMMAQFIATQT